jgi:DNA-binding winged helix-turn-helix (wHTH) protein/TolB-like protein
MVTFEFGPYHYDAEQRLLFRAGEVVPLAPKAIDTLHVLLERRGSVVDKADLMKLVWPDTQVEDVGLARNISILRKALEDESGECAYIETVPRRGYRFVEQATPVVEVKPGRAPRKWRWPVAAAVFAVALAALVYWQFYRPSRFLPGGGEWPNLAVMPFEPLGDGMNASLSQGFNEVLVGEIARPGGVHVMSPSTVRRYQRAGISAAVMARVLRLDVILEGTVQSLGGRTRVTARLADVHSGKLIWADTYEGAVDRDTARTIAAQVGAHLAIHGQFPVR